MKAAQVQADNELIERCLKRDDDAWRELVMRYQRLVYSVAHAVCRDADDVSDVFQQVWLDLYRHLADLRNVEALPAWLITVTRRRAYAVLRTRHDAEPLNEQYPEFSQRIRQIEQEHMIERAMEQLTERCRKLINFLYFDCNEPSYLEIAQQMGMPVPSVGPTRARCLEKLRKLIA